MKSVIQAVVVAAVLAAPAASFAEQSNAPVTRAQVRAELVQLAKVGYHVGDGDQTNYPVAIQAAEARVAEQNDTPSGSGGVVGGPSSSGSPAAAPHNQ
ncbi:hypothetical protein AYM40_07285 [Paraburkholderia phytofirmans OLGA172]|uniref:Purine-nucleoside phosphorylase n=1 Tax=Paraburkholderia phytofirmans OLGA172 TaxID=1417228 RepID=A0A161HY93_9BURK|nr:DUF4148 domain-containing protein [Paraburkholderia phytofirmans]ANB72187.1 hypothetical protein AYM40_07285 [Paraburkholderia phytofirmans OLGA172]